MSKTRPVILVVEDESLLLQAITRKLEKSDISTVSCISGKQALDYLSNLPELPDAVWLDYYLKDMNGLDFMREVRNNKKWQNIPVLVVSNSASEDKVHTMLALGATKYVLKAQYKLDEIIQMVKEYIRESHDNSKVA